ncbi:MAG: DNA-formamidopyrimidine glycosylase [Candidatus Marinimicrobia bacterium]|nr:DNA-formamidopyrimidine glycosylase [Candidatus Neomarinimicrobiota bacterium]|tara:strand:- start:23849 stop:24673 length:825 start_codon:yes stop_codon:yes gene_type:complete
MPELPEVQTVVKFLRDDLIGDRINRIKPKWPKVLSNFRPSDISVKNNSSLILDVTRRAKFIIFQFQSFIIAIHLRMTGKLFFLNSGKIPKHTSAIIELDSGKKLIFEDTRKFGRIYFYNDLKPIDERHGPEPLGENFTINWFRKELNRRKRNIKALLLDQSFLAGLGNIYVDESLWASAIHPYSISNAIPSTKVSRLHFNIKRILQDAINANGTTIIDFSFLNGQSGRYSNELCIFGKVGKPCLQCGHTIKKHKISGRGTYVCGKCQTKYLKKR